MKPCKAFALTPKTAILLPSQAISAALMQSTEVSLS